LTVRLVDRRPPPPPSDIPLWTLSKRGHRVSCTMRVLEHGLELVLLLDGELHRSQLYTFTSNTDMYREAADAKVAWQARGWMETMMAQQDEPKPTQPSEPTNPRRDPGREIRSPRETPRPSTGQPGGGNDERYEH
jgi:hypothetical protein